MNKYIIGLLITLALGSVWYMGKQNNDNTLNALSAMQAEMKVSKDKNGVTTSSIPIVQTSPKIYITATKDSNDPLVQRLREEIKTLKNGNVAVINSSGRIDALLKEGRAGDEWYTAEVRGDSLHYRDKHEFTVASVKRSGGMSEFIFKDRNPHDSTTAIRAFAPVDKKTKHWGVGPYAGYDISKGVSVGVCASYQLLQW